LLRSACFVKTLLLYSCFFCHLFVSKDYHSFQRSCGDITDVIRSDPRKVVDAAVGMR